MFATKIKNLENKHQFRRGYINEAFLVNYKDCAKFFFHGCYDFAIAVL